MTPNEAELSQRIYQPSAASLAQSLPHMADALVLSVSTLAGTPTLINSDAVLHQLESACHAVQRLRRRLVEVGE